MTVVSDIYNSIITKIEGELTGYKRLSNPYFFEESAAVLAKRAFGLRIGAGTNTERYVGCLATWQRDFTIILITQVVNTENDTLGRAMVEKDLLEANNLLFLAFEQDPTLSGVCIKAVINSDSEIDYFDGVQSKFLAQQLLVQVEYKQPTT